jgi:putative transposase
MWYHVRCRGKRREAVFQKPGDYDAFVEAIVDARGRLPVNILGYCRMPNHLHCRWSTTRAGLRTASPIR